VLFLLLATQLAAAADQVILNWEQDANGAALLSGQVIDDEFNSASGISVTVSVVSAHNVAAIFPSDAPPGVDYDLGTPNETCTPPGPGVGTGGEVGQPGENCTAQENVLIIPTSGDEDGDGFIDRVPNDDANGGTITFLFNMPVAVDYTEILDQESTENLTINTYADAAGTVLVTSTSPSGLGDNSYEFLDISALNVRRVDYEFLGSGAVASLAYTPPGQTAISLSSQGASGVDGTALLWVLIPLALLLTATAVLVRKTQRVQ
jgi:hypothetical protein